VIVLDPLPSGARGLAVGWWARLLGLHVEEAEFFTGHLRDDRGESVYRVARRESAQIAFRVAADVVARVPHLAALNARYGRQALRLFLAKRVWLEIELPLRKLLIARALARRGNATSRVILGVPQRVEGRWLDGTVPGAQVAFHGWRHPLVGWGSALQGFMRLAVATVRESLPRRGTTLAVQEQPAVLCLQEDDLGLDHTVRTQPHWLLPGELRPSFQIYIWLNHDALRTPCDRAALEAAGVTPLSESETAPILSRKVNGPLRP